jgi:hypothetical protein
MRSIGPARVLRAVAASCALVGALSGLAPAQAASPPQVFQISPDARNFEGVWWTRGYDRTYRQLDKSLPPFNAAGRAEWDRHVAAEKAGNPIGDAPTRCYPHGIPRMVASPYPIHILQTPGLVTLLHEVGHNIRYIHMDQQHPANLKPSFLGHSVGRWEGDTLVVDTIGFNDRTQVDEEGIVHGKKLHVVERYRKIDGGKTLEDIITIEDPDFFTAPWQARRTFIWRPDVRVSEYICEENNRNTPNEAGFTTAK